MPDSLERYASAFEDWHALGPETKRALLELLPDGWSFEGKRVLDFGCGAGRTLEHFLSEADAAEFWGADISAEAILSLQDRLCPPLHALRCETDPGLAFESEYFDLAWAISVFTHLTDNSIPWLLELHRLLRPGGLLIATYAGRWNSEYVAGEPWIEDRVGMNVLQPHQAWEAGGPTVLISDWWLRAHWGRAFEILAIEPRIHNMSWALLRKRDVELTVEDLNNPADDEREYLAARHNLRQLLPEIKLQQIRCEERVASVRQEYEASLSWNVTRPLRDLAELIRLVRSRRGH